MGQSHEHLVWGKGLLPLHKLLYLPLGLCVDLHMAQRQAAPVLVVAPGYSWEVGLARVALEVDGSGSRVMGGREELQYSL